MTCAECVAGAIGLVKAAAGIDAAGPATVAARRDACRACPHAGRRGPTGLTHLSRCKLCGCFVAAKTLTAGERCPDDPPRW